MIKKTAPKKISGRNYEQEAIRRNYFFENVVRTRQKKGGQSETKQSVHKMKRWYCDMIGPKEKFREGNTKREMKIGTGGKKDARGGEDHREQIQRKLHSLWCNYNENSTIG